MTSARRIKDTDEDGDIVSLVPLSSPSSATVLPSSSLSPAEQSSYPEFSSSYGGSKLASLGISTPDPANIVGLGGGLYQYHDPQTGKSFFAHDPSWTPGWLAKGEKLKSAVAAKHGEPRFCSDCHLNQLPYSYAYDTCSTCNNAKVGTPWYADEFGRRFPL